MLLRVGVGAVARRWLAFTPRDTILVRDGRPFDAGLDSRAEAVLPTPSTVAGAVGAAYGREPSRVRGPVFARHDPPRRGGGSGGRWSVFLPAPGDLVTDPDDVGLVRRLRPVAVDGVVTDISGQCPMVMLGDGEPLRPWLSRDVLQDYLHGRLLATGEDVGVPLDGLDVWCPQDGWVSETRVGLARDDDRVAQVGLLYQSSHLRTTAGVAVLAECEFDDTPPPDAVGVVRLGGRGRLADVTPVDVVDWPTLPTGFAGGRVLVYVATPAIWPQGWQIPLPADARLVAAVVADALPVATARPVGARIVDTALRWAVPAGSVYLLQFTDPDPDQAERDAHIWARKVHAKGYGRDARDRLLTAGFGVVLTGVWS
jgi:CRISPR-associated protein Cmr3